MHVHIYKVLKLKILKFFLKIKVWGVKTPAGNSILNQRQLPFLSYLTVNSKATNQGHAPRPRTKATNPSFHLNFLDYIQIRICTYYTNMMGAFQGKCRTPCCHAPSDCVRVLTPRPTGRHRVGDPL